jgi:hypothetical protein
MGPSFPLELVRNSLQSLQPIGSYWDVDALRSCALVCRTWTSLSQSKLFHALSISEDDFYLLSKLVKHSPHMGQFVHELNIECNFIFDFSTIISRVPAGVSSLLPHLSTLKYGGIIRHLGVLGFQNIHRLILGLEALQTLTIDLREPYHIPQHPDPQYDD